MSVALQKIVGVESVTVTLNTGEARVRLKPGNTVSLAAVRKVIERNGFTPRAATVIAEAEAVADKDGPAIRVTGSNETLPIAASTPDQVRSELKAQAGKRFIVEGVVGAPKENPSGSIEIKEMKPARK